MKSTTITKNMIKGRMITIEIIIIENRGFIMITEIQNMINIQSHGLISINQEVINQKHIIKGIVKNLERFYLLIKNLMKQKDNLNNNKNRNINKTNITINIQTVKDRR